MLQVILATGIITMLQNLIILILFLHSINLTWRDVQYLIVYTSNTNSLSNGEWQTNGAGLRVSHKFGFGAIDAEAMVTRAKRWINVPAQHNATIYPSTHSG